MRKKEKVLFAVNAFVITVILVLNYFYQSNGFNFTLKCICSGLFATLGLVNLGYVEWYNKSRVDKLTKI